MKGKNKLQSAYCKKPYSFWWEEDYEEIFQALEDLDNKDPIIENDTDKMRII